MVLMVFSYCVANTFYADVRGHGCELWAYDDAIVQWCMLPQGRGRFHLHSVGCYVEALGMFWRPVEVMEL